MIYDFYDVDIRILQRDVKDAQLMVARLAGLLKAKDILNEELFNMVLHGDGSEKVDNLPKVEPAEWVHSEAHTVECSNCGCRVSKRAAHEMRYCFKCGRPMKGGEA